MTSITRHSFWWNNSPKDFSFQSQLPTEADIVIIGANFEGISTAFWLARMIKKANRARPYRVIILDPAPHAGFRSSGRMIGNVYLGSRKPVSEVVNILGEKKAKSLYDYSSFNNKLLKEVLLKVDEDCEFNGGIKISSSQAETDILKDSTGYLAKWGFPTVEFDDQNSQHVVLNPRTQHSAFVPGEGMFDPCLFLNTIARTLRDHNVTIAYGADVLYSTSTNDGQPVVELTNGHTIKASKIIHTDHITSPLNDVLNDKMTYNRETVLRTEQLDDLFNDDYPLPLMPVVFNGGNNSLRIYNNSVIIAGGHLSSLDNNTELDEFNDSSCSKTAVDSLHSNLVINFPFLNNAEITHVWTYINKQSNDGLPFVGELPNFPGHFINTGYGGNKFGLAYLASRNLAQRLLHIKVTEPAYNLFSPKRIIQ